MNTTVKVCAKCGTSEVRGYAIWQVTFQRWTAISSSSGYCLKCKENVQFHTLDWAYYRSKNYKKLQKKRQVMLDITRGNPDNGTYAAPASRGERQEIEK